LHCYHRAGRDDTYVDLRSVWVLTGSRLAGLGHYHARYRMHGDQAVLHAFYAVHVLRQDFDRISLRFAEYDTVELDHASFDRRSEYP
jgi:hypothetical protein